MTSKLESPGDLLQRYGSVVSRLLRRQFPSLTADVVDSLVVECIARVWTHLEQKHEEFSPYKLFALIHKAARNRAIDQLRYSPRVVFVAPGSLEQTAAAYEGETSGVPADLVTDLKSAVSGLDPLDRRILEAAMTPPLAGDWARDLAEELIREEKNQNAECTDEIDPQKLKRLCGRLRVRKHRAIKQLRAAMQARGYEVPELSKVKP